MDALNEYTSSDDENDQIVPLSDHKQLVASLNPYSQNFAANQLDMASVFVSIPWKPTYATIRQLKTCSDRVRRHMELNHKEFYSKYDWSTFGVDTKMDPSVLGHHITVSTNGLLPAECGNKFVTEFKTAIGQMPVPKGLIKSSDDALLAKLATLKNTTVPLTATTRNQIHLNFQPAIKVFCSPNTNALFVGALLQMNEETEQLFGSITSVVRSVFTSVHNAPNEGLFQKVLHISLAKTGDKILHPLLSHSEVEDILAGINKEIESLEFPELQTIPVQIDAIDVSVQYNLQTTYSINFNLP